MFASHLFSLQSLRRVSLLLATLLCLGSAWAQTDSELEKPLDASVPAEQAGVSDEQTSDNQPQAQLELPVEEEQYWVRVELVVFTQPNPNLMAEYWDEQLRPTYAPEARLLMPAEGFERPLPAADSVPDDSAAMTGTGPAPDVPQSSTSTELSTAEMPSSGVETGELSIDSTLGTAQDSPQPGTLAYLPARPLPPLPEQDYTDGAFTLFSQEQRQQLLEVEPPQDRQGKPIHLLDLRRLERQGHRILFEGIWNQPVAEPDQSLPIMIRGGEALDADHFELDGEIRLSLSRFLHLHPNLYYSTELSDQWQTRDPHLLEAQAQAVSAATASMEQPLLSQAEPFTSLTASAAAGSASQQPITPLAGSEMGDEPEQVISTDPLVTTDLEQSDSRRFLTVKLDQPRRIRRDELHYLDHPLFGMLIRMVPIAAPVIEQDELITVVSSQAQPSITPTVSAAAPSAQ